eukprot:5800367-Prymnesium_polylepis.2
MARGWSHALLPRVCRQSSAALAGGALRDGLRVDNCDSSQLRKSTKLYVPASRAGHLHALHATIHPNPQP